MQNTGFFWIILYMIGYGAIHSTLASLKIKEKSVKWFGPGAQRWYRIFFNVQAVLTFTPVLLLVAFLPDCVIYRIPLPWTILFLLIQVSGVIGLLIGVSNTNVKHFLGIQQINGKGLGDHPTELVIKGLYRWVRHPLYTSSLLFIWFIPYMTWNILTFNIGATAYIVIGATFEEHKLLKAFGKQYADYRRKTPMLIPVLRRKNF